MDQLSCINVCFSLQVTSFGVTWDSFGLPNVYFSLNIHYTEILIGWLDISKAKYLVTGTTRLPVLFCHKFEDLDMYLLRCPTLDFLMHIFQQYNKIQTIQCIYTFLEIVSVTIFRIEQNKIQINIFRFFKREFYFLNDVFVVW